MTDPQPTPDTVTVASQSIELLLTGKPDVKYKWDSGSIRPSLVTFTYRQEGIHAHLFGVWVREDGQLADAPCDQLYRVDDTDWPDWLAALATAHDRRSAVPSAPAARAAEERLSRVHEWVTSEVVTAQTEFGNGYRAAQRDIRDLIKGRFDNDAANELRRAADEAQQVPTDEDVVEAHRLALSFALDLGTGAPWDAIHDRTAELRRAADEVGTASSRSPERDGAEFKVPTSSLNSDSPSGVADEAQQPETDGADPCSGCQYVPCGNCPPAVGAQQPKDA